MSVTLRPFAPADGVWLDEWLPAVAASVGCGELASSPSVTIAGRARSRAGFSARLIERDHMCAGVVVYRIRNRGRESAIVELIATPASEARRGSGMKAAAIVEDEMRAVGVRRIYAPAPEVHGIAMYFWIRLGYHPLLRPEWPCERDGVAWLARNLT